MHAALITGASSGIGRALALEMAKSGRDVVLIGRDEAALEAARQQCLRAGAVHADALAFDLSREDAPARIHAALADKKIQVEILVNNAGIGVHGEFSGTPLERELELVHVQVDAMLTLTKLFLPSMIANRRGRILNVSSVYSFAPVPQQAVYGASKAFMLSFSEALAHELKGTGVSVTVLCPGSTRTEFRRRAGVGKAPEQQGSESGMDPAAVARAGIRALEAGRFLAVPGLHNALFTNVMKHLPHALRTPLMQFINARRGLHPKSPEARQIGRESEAPQDPRRENRR